MSDSEIGRFIQCLAVVFGACLLGAAIDKINGLRGAFAIIFTVVAVFWKFIWTRPERSGS